MTWSLRHAHIWLGGPLQVHVRRQGLVVDTHRVVGNGASSKGLGQLWAHQAGGVLSQSCSIFPQACTQQWKLAMRISLGMCRYTAGRGWPQVCTWQWGSASGPSLASYTCVASEVWVGCQSRSWALVGPGEGGEQVADGWGLEFPWGGAAEDWGPGH